MAWRVHFLAVKLIVVRKGNSIVNSEPTKVKFCQSRVIWINGYIPASKRSDNSISPACRCRCWISCNKSISNTNHKYRVDIVSTLIAVQLYTYFASLVTGVEISLNSLSPQKNDGQVVLLICVHDFSVYAKLQV